MQDLIPSLFQVSIGGVPGSGYAVELEGDCLRYDSSLASFSKNRPRRIRPSKASWENFWQELHEVDIWSWRNHYVLENNSSTGDNQSTSWQVAIQFKGQSMASAGKNAYPAESHAGEISPMSADDRMRFEKFNQAVCRLIGGLPFRPRAEARATAPRPPDKERATTRIRKQPQPV